MRVFSAVVGAALLVGGVVGVAALGDGAGAGPAVVAGSPADRPEQPSPADDASATGEEIEAAFGDVSDYCAAVPLAQEYVDRVGSDPGAVDLGGMRAAFRKVRATAPEVIRDEWAAVQSFEVLVVRMHRRLALTDAEQEAVAAKGVDGLRPSRQREVEQVGTTLSERISDPELQSAATRAVDATRDLCGLELAPQGP